VRKTGKFDGVKICFKLLNQKGVDKPL